MADRAKDHYEKKLGNYDDVFADIFNVLVFRGENRILDSDLRTGMARSGSAWTALTQSALWMVTPRPRVT